MVAELTLTGGIIYANPTSDILLVAEPSPLEKHIDVACRQIIRTYSDAIPKFKVGFQDGLA